MPMHTIDLSIIIVYFTIILIIGILVSKRAIKDIDSYFLGSKTLPWWILGISNASGMFDITGTMWLVYLLFVYGLKSVWIPWLWPIFNQIFLMAYLSIWLRRSNVMTGAQWIETRFGNGKGAHLAHYIVVCFALVSLVGFIAYDFKGIGKFAKIFLPWDLSADTYAIILMSITAIYAVKGGMVSVVATEVLQFLVMTLASIAVGIVAMNAVSPEILNSVVPRGWKDIFFGWRLNLDWSGILDSVNQKISQDGYELFTIFMMMVLFKGILVSAAGPAPNYDMQRILATKNPKEAAKMSWFVSVVLFFPRYMMITGLTVLALAFLMPELKAMGTNIDFEMVLPLALKNLIPVGLIGVLLAGLLAAFMSTYAATINAAPAYVVNDIYKKFINPNAPPKKYVKLSIIVSAFFVLLGFIFGILAQSVNQVTLWIVNGLWGGYTAANVLKWYWWRLNGYGYFWGMVIGIACALLMPILFPSLPALNAFPYVLAISILGCVLGSYLTEPEPEEILMKFFIRVRPWGFWKPIRKKVEERFPEFKSDANIKRDLFNVAIGIIWQATLLAAPMYLVTKEYKLLIIILIITLITSIILKFSWWDNLEKIAGDKTEKFYQDLADKI